ncbi:hypothetical protein OIU85_018704 [Salix viminalis]|uniref:Uncharacterized protein n=1 Tax=Salix viminalis TaxID=40686 RepID=A0A9Q0ZJ41_SALVM|nr:hypothetical protein OIU85_018704 [Salix viminalis]
MVVAHELDSWLNVTVRPISIPIVLLLPSHSNSVSSSTALLLPPDCHSGSSSVLVDGTSVFKPVQPGGDDSIDPNLDPGRVTNGKKQEGDFTLAVKIAGTEDVGHTFHN